MQNFGKIKNAFNEILAESMFSKDDTNKLLFKKYIKTIKESEILKTQFLVYNNIETKFSENTDNFTSNLYVTENLKLLEKYKVSDIIKENKKLIDLSESIKNNIDKPYNPTLESLHESISKLIFTKRTPKTVDVITENITNVIDYIKSNKPRVTNEAIELPTSMITTMMVDKYNEKYSILEEAEKKVLRALINSTDEQKKEVYTETVRECISLINERLTGADLNQKDKLLQVKEKLLNNTDDASIIENFEKNISKLIDLRESLK